MPVGGSNTPGLLSHLRAAATWWRVKRQVRGRGVDPAGLTRVRRMIRVGAGAEAPSYEHDLQRPASYLRGLRAKPWWEAGASASAARVQARLEAVAAEARRAYDEGLFVPKQAERVAAGAWSTCYLFYLGRRVERTARQCPATTALIESLADTSSLGLFYFCALEPRSELAPHTAYTNVKLRIQLNLSAPDGAAIVVGGEERSVRAGDCLVLDESFRNVDRNRGDTTRLALMVDVWHPDLTSDEIVALEALSRVSLNAGRRRLAAERAARTGRWL